MSQKRNRSPSPSSSRDNASARPTSESSPRYALSSIIEDRASRFLGIFSPDLDAGSLALIPETKGAMHKMTASRLPGKQLSLAKTQASPSATPSMSRTYDLHHDDDGEKYGGRTLEKLLLARRVEGTVMVARWFGGVMLGPVRFDHIRRAGEEAISSWMTMTMNAEGAGGRGESPAVKRSRLDGNATTTVGHSGADVDIPELVETLEQRDESIIVLRGLLAEKQAMKTSASTPTATVVAPSKEVPTDTNSASSQPTLTASSPAAPTSSAAIASPDQPKRQAPKPDYKIMPAQTLQRLEGARDKTIAWLLEQIDKAEMEVQQKGEEREPD